MLGIGYFKAEPSEYAKMMVKGKVKEEGAGIACIYLPFRTSIELLSIAANNHPFVFDEISKDNQQVTIQGDFFYQIIQPEITLKQYNFSIDPRTKQYLTDDNSKLPQYLVHIVQANTKRIAQSTPLEELLVMSAELADNVMDSLQQSDIESDIGVNLSKVYISSIRPKPEIAKALEANYRESLLENADQAIYKRRALAVENELAIQENEINNEMEIEQKRIELVNLKGKNQLKESEFEAQAVSKGFESYERIDAAKLTAHALYQMGKNAHKINNLTITPDILASIMQGAGKRGG